MIKNIFEKWWPWPWPLCILFFSKMGVIWKFVRLHHLRTQLWTDFDGTWSNLFGKSIILAPPSRFFRFLHNFFINCKNMHYNIKKLISDIQMHIFCLLGKKWGKNWKKRLGGARMVDFLNKLLQVPSKSVHNCVRKWCKRRNFHITPIFEQKIHKGQGQGYKVS